MKKTIKIGRDSTNDVIINEASVSRSHAMIMLIGDKEYEIKDLGSANGTFVNGKRVSIEIIHEGDKVEVSNCLVNWQEAFANSKESLNQDDIMEEPFAKIIKTIYIGSSPDNDIVIEDNFVSSHHAMISLLKNGSYFIKDLGSKNGTWINEIKVSAKNFIKTDVVFIGSKNLPLNWFENKNLKANFLRDHKKSVFWFLVVFILLMVSVTYYFKGCKWFDCNCNKNKELIFKENKQSLVFIQHSYFYTLEILGKKYFVGKNKQFGVVEANTDKLNLLPYSSVQGNGCFVRSDGMIITSSTVVYPWLNKSEQSLMIKEVTESKTIENLSKINNYLVYGETDNIKFISNGAIFCEQNFVSATLNSECDSSKIDPVLIQSVKKKLSESATFSTCFYNDKIEKHLHSTNQYYLFSIFTPFHNKVINDTLYDIVDSSDLNKTNMLNLKGVYLTLPEGSPVFNERGEIIGVKQQQKVILMSNIHKFLNQ